MWVGGRARGIAPVGRWGHRSSPLGRWSGPGDLLKCLSRVRRGERKSPRSAHCPGENVNGPGSWVCGEVRHEARTCARRLGLCWAGRPLDQQIPTGLRKAGLKNPCTAEHRDCGLIRVRCKGIRGREDCCGSIFQVRNDSWGTPNDKATVLTGKQGNRDRCIAEKILEDFMSQTDATSHLGNLSWAWACYHGSLLTNTRQSTQKLGACLAGPDPSTWQWVTNREQVTLDWAKTLTSMNVGWVWDEPGWARLQPALVLTKQTGLGLCPCGAKHELCISTQQELEWVRVGQQRSLFMLR